MSASGRNGSHCDPSRSSAAVTRRLTKTTVRSTSRSNGSISKNRLRSGSRPMSSRAAMMSAGWTALRWSTSFQRQFRGGTRFSSHLREPPSRHRRLLTLSSPGVELKLDVLRARSAAGGPCRQLAVRHGNSDQHARGCRMCLERDWSSSSGIEWNRAERRENGTSQPVTRPIPVPGTCGTRYGVARKAV